jgi:hypothetical protein
MIAKDALPLLSELPYAPTTTVAMNRFQKPLQ